MQGIAVAILVVVMMVAIGLRTQPRELAEIGRRPLAMVAAVVVNVALIPALVLLSTRALALPTEITVGLLVCASAPAGPMGVLFAARARGHIATSVTAMLGLSMLSVVTAPLVLASTLGMSDALGADAIASIAWPMTRTLVLFQLAPLVAGMLVRRVRPALAERLAMPTTKLANALLLVVILGLLVMKGRVLADVGLAAMLLAAALVPMCMALGFAIPGPSDQRRSLAMVTGVRNISLALLLGATYFPAALTDATILTAGLFCMVLPLVIARMVRSRSDA